MKRSKKTASSKQLKSDPNLIEFRDSGIHGRGGFATQDMAKGTRIIEYTGKQTNAEEATRQCNLNNPFFVFFLMMTTTSTAIWMRTQPGGSITVVSQIARR